MSSRSDRLRERFSDEEYRHAYADSSLNTTLAAQIEFLRKQRNWSQEELGRRVGMKQSAISRIESIDYSKWSVGTLRKLARAFDLTLSIRFESFGTFLRDLENRSRETLLRPSFDEDPAFVIGSVPAATTSPEWQELSRGWTTISVNTTEVVARGVAGLRGEPAGGELNRSSNEVCDTTGVEGGAP